MRGDLLPLFKRKGGRLYKDFFDAGSFRFGQARPCKNGKPKTFGVIAAGKRKKSDALQTVGHDCNRLLEVRTYTAREALFGIIRRR